jgi:ABC-type multidrug transport system ATPase subunit
VAKHGRTVICTIHQPRSDIFDLFHQVFLMSQGHAVYFGARDQMVNYFTELNHPCPTFQNPADFASKFI